MKNLFRILETILLLIFIHSCKKDTSTVPSIITESATDLTNTTATLNGTANANNSSTTLTFEYGSTTSYGKTAVAIQSPIIGSSSININIGITGLTSGLLYHYRAKAVNAIGIIYGEDVQFSTTVTDYEDNVYTTVTIGAQVWMVENLKTTKYRNGDLIGTTTPVTLDISSESSPKYQWAYNGNENNISTFGRLYTWYAVTDSRNLCPAGWHVPNGAEWTTLTTYLGGEAVAGGKLKETGTTHWQSPNTDATNESSFIGLPGGSRLISTFDRFGFNGFWWSSTEFSTSGAHYLSMYYNYGMVYRDVIIKKVGFSVRCLRD